MNKISNTPDAHTLNMDDYQNLIENLRIRLNVLSASFFLLEEKLIPNDLSIINYISRINSELEVIRKMILKNPAADHKKI